MSRQTFFFFILVISITILSIPQQSYAQTCGLALNDTTFDFGSLEINALSGEDDVAIEFSNSGDTTADVTVSAKNWLASSIIHIAGQFTKFSTSDEGTNGLGVSYASKNPLNSTDGAVAFGVIPISPSINNTYWQLSAILQNLPFTGAITQEITFTANC